MEITEADVLSVIGRALDGMAGILTDLGDELANARPDLPLANSPYGILTHCLGVVEYWVGQCVAGRVAERDRDAEFRAVGPVGPLVDRIARTKEQVALDIAGVDMTDPLTVDREPPLLASIRTQRYGVAARLRGTRPAPWTARAHAGRAGRRWGPDAGRMDGRVALRSAT